jgi:transposase
LEQAKQGKIKLYFGDAVHIIYGATLGYSWCITREEVLSAYGRQRFNVMGLLDSETHETITVTNETYITSSEIVKLLKKIRRINKDKKVSVVLDNAKYQKCNLVKDAAKENKIDIIYLPTYSPNLNLIERLWKYLRSECLSNKFSMTFGLFCKSIVNCLSKTSSAQSKKKLDTLLAHNFETLGT